MTEVENTPTLVVLDSDSGDPSHARDSPELYAAHSPPQIISPSSATPTFDTPRLSLDQDGSMNEFRQQSELSGMNLSEQINKLERVESKLQAAHEELRHEETLSDMGQEIEKADLDTKQFVKEARDADGSDAGTPKSSPRAMRASPRIVVASPCEFEAECVTPRQGEKAEEDIMAFTKGVEELARAEEEKVVELRLGAGLGMDGSDSGSPKRSPRRTKEAPKSAWELGSTQYLTSLEWLDKNALGVIGLWSGCVKYASPTGAASDFALTSRHFVQMVLNHLEAYQATDAFIPVEVAQQVSQAPLGTVGPDGKLQPHHLSRLQDSLTSRMSQEAKQLLQALVSHWGHVAAEPANGMSARFLTSCMYIYVFPYDVHDPDAAAAELEVNAFIQGAIERQHVGYVPAQEVFPEDRLWQLLHHMIQSAAPSAAPRPPQTPPKTISRRSPAQTPSHNVAAAAERPHAQPVGALGPSEYVTRAGHVVRNEQKVDTRGNCRGCVQDRCVVS